MATNNSVVKNDILHKDLSYKVQGFIFDIRNEMGSGHKELIYQKLLEKKLKNAGLIFVREPAIKIFSAEGDFLGLYRPDFLIENKIIIELKAHAFITKQELSRVYDYLRNSEYELAYLVNFASKNLYYKRFIFTNDRKRWVKNLLLFVAISIAFVAISGVQIHAATLILSPSTGAPNVPQHFTILITLDPEGENVNALEGKISFSNNLKLTNINDGSSVVGIWIQKPSLANGVISFSGIMPGGYRGDLGAGWTGYHPGKMMELSFEASGVGPASVMMSNARVLLNDGLGTPAKLTVYNLNLTVTGEGGEAISAALASDKNPPLDFTPEIVSNPDIFNGKWTLVFLARDNESGIDRVEIREVSTSWFSRIVSRNAFWTKAESPYLLKDQGLKSTIEVKAIDRAGNLTVERIEARYPLAWYENYTIWGILIGIAILGIIVFRVLLYGKKKRSST